MGSPSALSKRTAKQQSRDYGPALAKASALTYPLVIPHRGAGQHIYPQGTIDTYLTGAAMGFACIDGGDLRMLADGSFVDYHDTDLATVTTATGNPWNVTSAAQMKMLPLRAVSSFPSTLTLGSIAEFREIARRLGGKVVLTPEIKRDGTSPPASGVQGTAFAALLTQLGLTKSVMVGSFFLPELTPCIAAGVECAFFISGDATTAPNIAAAAAAVTAGCAHVYITATGGTNTTASVAAIAALGAKVGVAVISRQYDWTAWQAAGVVECFSENPVYIGGDTTKYRQTADSFGTGVFPHGMIAADESAVNRGTIVNGRWWPVLNAATVLLGQFSPVDTPSAYTFNFTVCFEAIGSDTARHADIVVSAADDRYFDAAVPRSVNNGYILAVRPAALNQLQVYEVVNGVTTSKANVSGVAAVAPLVLTAQIPASATTTLTVSAVAADIPSGTQFMLPTGQLVTTSALASAGATSVSVTSVTPTAVVPVASSIPQAMRCKIQVTSTQVIATRLDTSTVATATSSAVRGGYLHAGQNNSAGASGMRVSYTSLSVT